MAFKHHTYLDLSKPDSLGQYPDKKWINKSFFHPKTRRIYTVFGFVWNSTTDEWNVKYKRAGCDIEFTRTLKEFKEPERFVEIDTSDIPGGKEDDD